MKNRRFCGTGKNAPVGRVLKDLQERKEKLLKGEIKPRGFYDYLILNPQLVEEAYEKVRWWF